MTVTMYVGKEQIKVDLDNLLGTDISVLDKITYDVAKKYGDFIAAIEITVEDCLGTVVNIIDEASYKLAIADLVNIINQDKEETIMNNTTIIPEVTVNNVTLMEEKAMKDVEMREVTVKETTNKEESNMVDVIKGDVKAAVDEMMGKFVEAKKSVVKNANMTKEEYVEKIDDSLNTMKGALGNTLDVIDSALGYSVLKNAILDMMEAGTDGKTSKKDLFKMAKRCRELVEEEIENLEYWGDAESFKKAVQLKAITENERGKSIFEAFVSGCIWIANKVTEKINGLDEKSVLGAICRSISGFVGLLKAGVKIVWNTLKFAASFVVAGVVKVVDFVFRAIKTLVIKIKDWASEKFNKIDDDFDDFDDDFDNDMEVYYDEEGNTVII